MLVHTTPRGQQCWFIQHLEATNAGSYNTQRLPMMVHTTPIGYQCWFIQHLEATNAGSCNTQRLPMLVHTTPFFSSFLFFSIQLIYSRSSTAYMMYNNTFKHREHPFIHTLKPTLLFKHAWKSVFMSITGTLSCGLLGPDRHGVMELRSISTI